MSERFTGRARSVVAAAENEARRFGSESIGPDHILLGLLSVRGVALAALMNLRANVRALRRAAEALLREGKAPADLGTLPQTPQAKKVIEYAAEEARRLQHRYVGTEHLLLGLLRSTGEPACMVLESEGLSLEAARAEVHDLLGTGPGEESAGV